MESSPVNDMLIRWPSTRGPSLDDEQEAAKFASEVNAGLWNAFAPLPSSTPQVPPAQEAPRRWASIEDEDQAAAFSEEIDQTLKTHTFSQWPATRGPSIEDSAPYAQWPATRGPSLEEFMEAKEQDPLVLGGIPREEAVAWPSTRGPSLDEFVEASTFPMFPNPEPLRAVPSLTQIVESRFMQWAPTMDTYADNLVQGQSFDTTKIINRGESHSIFQELLPSDASTNEGDDEAATLTPPTGVSDDECDKECYADQSATLKISLTDSLGLWSVGSAGHDFGNCKPCAFLWKDPLKPGCQNGRDCVFCHLCPPGEVKRRKREKKVVRKMNRNFRYQNQVLKGFETQFQCEYQDQNQTANGFERCEYDFPGNVPNGFGQYENGTHFAGW